MIKINISEEQKEKIEKIIWNDAITASTGILKEYMQQVSIIIRRHRNQSGFLRLFKINCILQLQERRLRN